MGKFRPTITKMSKRAVFNELIKLEKKVRLIEAVVANLVREKTNSFDMNDAVSDQAVVEEKWEVT